MHLLVSQHVDIEHRGVLRRGLAEEGHSWDAVNLGQGEALPDLDGPSWVVMMGCGSWLGQYSGLGQDA